MTKSDLSHSKRNSLTEWLSYLETIHSTEIDLGLARIQQVASKLDIDLSFAQVVIVGGTNGKGTTCAFIENAFLAKAKSVAVYSSPHIEKFNERLRINKADIDDTSLINAFERIEATRGETSLTYYEYTTLAAFLVLMARNPDVIILEVGLGGRLDATNMIDADIAVITTVDLDHQAFLGNDRESIGYEKAGIMRKNRPSVIGDCDIPNSVVEFGNGIQTCFSIRDKDFFVEVGDDKWQWQFQQQVLNNLAMPHIPLDNVATALAVLALSGESFDTDAINKVIEQTRVPGRTELITGTPDVLLDVGHNPQSIRYLAEKIKSLAYPKVIAVVGMLADKDISASLQSLAAIVDDWYFCSLNVPRGATAQQILDKTQSFISTANCFDNACQAFKMACENSQPTDLVIVFGSFYTVAEIRPRLV